MFVDARGRRPVLPGQERAGCSLDKLSESVRARWMAPTRHLPVSHAKKEVLLTPSATGLQTSGKLMLRHRGPFVTQPKAARE